MIEQIRNALHSPMENYRQIAQGVTKKRGKAIGWRTVMYYLQGREIGIADETKVYIEETALDLIKENAEKNLQLVDHLRPEVAG